MSDVDQLKRDAALVVQDVKNHANAHVDETKQRVNDAIHNLLPTHPVALLGLGFVFGFLFGFRFNR